MKILAIETSCDDTSVAVLKARGKKYPRFKILSNIVSSQTEIHKKWGGVFPSLAKREHQKNLPLILKNVLRKNFGINLIAVTQGPGLEPCLWVGINFAKNLSKELSVSLIPISHIEAHIFSNFLTPKSYSKSLFPAISLVVSGGHTQLILMKDVGKYKILGETRDDAAGECFDKVARILGLGYPGGPLVAKLAAKHKQKNKNCTVSLPRPMIFHKNYDFSFSGLKTAVLYLVKNLTDNGKKQLSKKQIGEICNETQQAIIDVLLTKTTKAVKNCKTKSIILGGGVTANEELRKQFKSRCSKLKIKFLAPSKNLSTDNAVMVAITAYFNYLKNFDRKYGDIKADANLALPIN
ncbi:tRNA (adenosine(37)-N6)-threonylcarbamoyltransferase complex transferase subunit TsaD [Patescibacteria group bacterium]